MGQGMVGKENGVGLGLDLGCLVGGGVCFGFRLDSGKMGLGGWL